MKTAAEISAAIVIHDKSKTAKNVQARARKLIREFFATLQWSPVSRIERIAAATTARDKTRNYLDRSVARYIGPVTAGEIDRALMAVWRAFVEWQNNGIGMESRTIGDEAEKQPDKS